RGRDGRVLPVAQRRVGDDSYADERERDRQAEDVRKELIDEPFASDQRRDDEVDDRRVDDDGEREGQEAPERLPERRVDEREGATDPRPLEDDHSGQRRTEY